MKAFVTGATGFLGSHLTGELIKKGYEVSVLIRKTSSLRYLSALPVNFVYGSVENLESPEVIREIENTEYIYHVAGITKAMKKEDYYRVNRDGTAKICKLCKKYARNLKKLVIISTLAVYGPKKGYEPIKEDDPPNPVSPYGKSKLEGDQIALSFKTEVPLVIIRPGAIYGPRDFDFLRVIKGAMKGFLPVPGFKKKIVNLAFVSDIVEIILRAGEEDTVSGEIFLAGGFNHTWNEVADILSRVFNRRVVPIRIPKSLVYFSAFFGELVSQVQKKPLPLSLTRIVDLMGDNWGIDLTKAEKKLGFKPKVPLDEGMRITVEWYRKEGIL